MHKQIRWRRYPFVRLLLPFVAGVVLADISFFPNYYYSLILFLLTLAGVFLFQFFKRRPSAAWPDGILLYFLFFLLGIFTIRIHDPGLSDQYFKHFTPLQKASLVIRIDDLDPSDNWFKINGTVIRTLDSNKVWHLSNGKILLFAARDSATLLPGDVVCVSGKLMEVPPPLNPEAFDYRKYLFRKDVLYEIFARKDEWTVTGYKDINLSILASNLRLRLVALIKEYVKPEGENSVAAALLLGYRNDLSDELNNAYINTGSIHILAVSGLHVGLVSGILMLFLNFFKKNNLTVRLIKLTVILGFIWFFVLLTGAGASVVRAAVMFSFIHTGQLLLRRKYIYNTIAASVFVILIWCPQMLFDVGFHLSLSAVLGIIALQPFLLQLYHSENKIIHGAWELTTVTIAAQLATLPIALYYFHQTSLYFLISGIFVVPISSFALYAGVGLAIFHWIVPVLAKLAGTIMYWSVFAMNSIIYAIAGMPYNLITDIPFNTWEFLLLSTTVVFVTVYVSLRRKALLYMALAAFLIFSITRIAFNYAHSAQQILIFYNTKENVFVDYFNGNSCISLRENTDQREEKYVASGARMAYRILETTNIHTGQSYAGIYNSDEGLLSVRNYRLKFLFKNSENFYGIGEGTSVYVCEDVRSEDCVKDKIPQMVFLGSKIDFRTRKNWKKFCADNNIRCIDLKSESYVLKL